MSFQFNPSRQSSLAFRSLFADSMGERLLIQSEAQSGWHSSRSEPLPHLTIKNSLGQTTGHYLSDGRINDFNGSLGWLQR